METNKDGYYYYKLRKQLEKDEKLDDNQRTEVALRVGDETRTKYSFTWYTKAHRWRYFGSIPVIEVNKVLYSGFSLGFCVFGVEKNNY